MKISIQHSLYFAACLTCATIANGQSCDGTQTFTDIKINSDNVTWTVENDCKKAIYQIKEFRWNKWIVLGSVSGIGNGTNKYSYDLMEVCDLYKVRIELKGSRTCRSISVKNPGAPSATGYSVGETNIAFTRATRYEIFSTEGIRELKGCAEKVRVAELKKGVYYLNYAKQMVKFIRK